MNYLYTIYPECRKQVQEKKKKKQKTKQNKNKKPFFLSKLVQSDAEGE